MQHRYMIQRESHPLTYECLAESYRLASIVVSDRSQLSALMLTEGVVSNIESSLAHSISQGVVLRDEVCRWRAGGDCAIALSPVVAMGIEVGKDPRADLGYLLYGTVQGDV